MHGMEIGVTNTAGLGFDQDLARLGRRYVKLLKHQRLSELLNNRGLHFMSHDLTPLFTTDFTAAWFATNWMKHSNIHRGHEALNITSHS
jgi:hypothetical protein